MFREVHIILQTPEFQKHFHVRGRAGEHQCIGSIDLDLAGAGAN